MFEAFLRRLGFHVGDKYGDSVIRVVLSMDRQSDGTLAVYQNGTDQVFGPASVICTIDRDFADRAGNPEGDWQKPFGEVPVGRYRLLGLAHANEVPLPVDEETGPHPILVFRAISGQAAVAQANGRGDLLLHGGPLVPGLGVLRLDDDSIIEVLKVLSGSVTLEVNEQKVPLTRSRRRERMTSPTGHFPQSSAVTGHIPLWSSPSSSSPVTTPDDPMDGFLLSYMIGWPMNTTPGAVLGALLHQSEAEQRDHSAANLRDLGVPVIDQPQPADPQSADPQDANAPYVPDTTVPNVDPTPFATPATPDASPAYTSPDPAYTPSGGAYDR